ncbi:MAG: A24 family peptidase [Chloroflexota bacterium]|nr:A24 family peptidase [Chloroflexota bacterium]
MFLESCAVAITGILAGGLINTLADHLPSGQPLRMPQYPDGSRRPKLAWLGIGAFLFNLRSLPAPSGDELGTLSQSSGPGGALLSWRYPLTEIATALLMLLFYADIRADIRDEAALLSTAALFKFAYAALFVLIAVIDLEHRRIPFAVAFALGALALIDAALIPVSEPGMLSAVIGGLIGFALFYIAFLGGVLFARALSRKRGKPLEGGALGFGDVVLMAAAGLAVGFPGILLAITLSVFTGAAGAIAVVCARFMKTGSYQPFDKIPYGPFIAGSAITLLLIGN